MVLVAVRLYALGVIESNSARLVEPLEVVLPCISEPFHVVLVREVRYI